MSIILGQKLNCCQVFEWSQPPHFAIARRVTHLWGQRSGVGNQHGPRNFRPFQKETIAFQNFSFQVLLLLVSGRVYGVKRPLDRSSLLGILSLSESLTKQDFQGDVDVARQLVVLMMPMAETNRSHGFSDHTRQPSNPLVRGRTSWFSGGITFSVLGL